MCWCAYSIRHPSPLRFVSTSCYRILKQDRNQNTYLLHVVYDWEEDWAVATESTSAELFHLLLNNHIKIFWQKTKPALDFSKVPICLQFYSFFLSGQQMWYIASDIFHGFALKQNTMSIVPQFPMKLHWLSGWRSVTSNITSLSIRILTRTLPEIGRIPIHFKQFNFFSI